MAELTYKEDTVVEPGLTYKNDVAVISGLNFNPTVTAPIDIRLVVNKLSDLINNGTWSDTHIYAGMIVSVVEEKNESVWYIPNTTVKSNIDYYFDNKLEKNPYEDPTDFSLSQILSKLRDLGWKKVSDNNAVSMVYLQIYNGETSGYETDNIAGLRICREAGDVTIEVEDIVQDSGKYNASNSLLLPVFENNQQTDGEYAYVVATRKNGKITLKVIETSE